MEEVLRSWFRKQNTTRVVIALLLAMGIAMLAALWTAHALYQSRKSAQIALAERSVHQTAREIVTLISDMRRQVSHFGQEQQPLLKQLLARPDDQHTQTRLETALRRSFPDYYAFSIAAPDGRLLIDDFGEAIGDLCRAEIARFATDGQAQAVIHPGPGAYHFDLMVPWPVNDEGGIFFISFRPQRLVEAIQAAQLPGHRLLLSHAEQPTLIEVSAGGTRDHLDGQHRLSGSELRQIRQLGAEAPVPDTGWRVVSLPEEALVAGIEREFLLRSGGSLLLITLVGGGVIGSYRHSERRRRQHEEQQRLDAAVFNSAQEGIAITALDGTILRVNRAFTRITEYEAEEIIGHTPARLQSGRHPPAFYQQLWKALQVQGTWHGEIWNRRKSGEIYLEWLSISSVFDESGLPLNYVAVYTDISRIHHAQSQLEYLAHHDPLTGLPNRLLLQSRLQHAMERAQREAGRLAVLFLDLDHFKEVNDRLGHAAGDELLQQVASLLNTRLRQLDTIARLGGDEFVVVIEAIDTPAQAGHVAEEIISLLAQPFTLGNDDSAHIGVSIGISLYPDDTDRLETLIELADDALYRAKDAGRNTYRFSGRNADKAADT